MLFRKRNVNLHHGMVGEAIAIKSKLDFKKKNPSYSDKRTNDYIKERIDVDEHTSFGIYHIHYTNEFSSFGIYSSYLNYYCMYVKTYIDNVVVNSYEFKLDMKNKRNFYREWELMKKTITHKLPPEIIIKINQWAENIVEEKHKELHKERVKAQQRETEILLTEEDRLEKVFQDYKLKKNREGKKARRKRDV